MYKMNNFLFPAIVMVALTLVCSSVLHARQFRQILPIATPNKSVSSLPEGAIAVEKPQQLDRGTVETAVNAVVSKWNTGDMQSTLDDSFFDKARLGDAVDTLVPRDATMIVQSVQGVQTLQLYIMPQTEGDDLVSIVSATVRTQLEFNSAETGFVRLPGVNEFILKVSQPAPR